MNSRTPTLCRLLTFLLALALIAVPALAKQQPTERSPGFFDKAAAADHQRIVHGWLMSERATLADRNPLELRLSAADLASVEKAVNDGGRLRVGVAADVGLAVDFAAKPRAGEKAARFAHGALRNLEDGWVWTSVVRSPGASALRVHFESFFLPVGSELYVYNRQGEAFGPYTGRGPLQNGEFWSNTVIGDELTLQVRSRPTLAVVKTLGEPRFTISSVGHMGPEFLAGVLGQRNVEEKAFCSFNESCVENANCGSTHSAVAAARDGVAHMLFISGRYYYICSGGLLADTDSSSTIPYFLTANHCISKGTEASSLENFYQFETPCGGSCYDPYASSLPRTLGASILSTSSTSDYTLMQLSQVPPAGSAYLGWDSSPIAFSNGAGLYRISHPGGAPQAYSEHTVDTSKGTCQTWPRGNWIYSNDEYGATEGGSSGSPVLNSSGLVVGQLSGGCGTNVYETCDTVSNATVDGALAAYFGSVSQWLDPGTSCTDSDGDGFCASDDCDDFDAAVNPGASEVCGDGKDNDCDGTVDDGCGSCLPVGASCSSDSDCCGNKCKGGRNKSCK